MRIAAGVVFGGIAIWLASGLFSGGSVKSIPTALVKRGDIQITITESGELRAEHQATINASNDKRIIWLAPEGSWVKEGDPLVKFEAEKYIIAKAASESAMAVAEADLVKAKSDLAAHQSKEKQARLDYQGLPELAEKGFITQNEVESARLMYEEVRSQTTSFEAAVRAAHASVAYASQEVEQQQRKLDEGTIRAPREGLVVLASFGSGATSRKIQVGMTPFEGMELMYLPDISSMVVDTEIGEVDLSKVKLGTQAKLRLDAYPDLEFNGEVTYISMLARQKISKITGKPTGIKVFDVTISVMGNDNRLKPGLSTTVDLLVSEHQDVFYFPVSGVFLDDLNEPIAYVETGGEVELRRIGIGGSSERVAVITAGVEEGDKVLLARPPKE
ncbi:efflux RND transporter periplasmic adaptor subunit [Myxococcota bacterium]|nr:efflux RND transporter periplasmic adaptor subunit [Myxococcota bacterium]